MADAKVLREMQEWNERKRKHQEFDRMSAQFSGAAPDDEKVDPAVVDELLAMTSTGQRVLEQRQAATLEAEAAAKATQDAQGERNRGHENNIMGGI